MRAVIPAIEPAILEERKRLGLDRWDEMWEGELHMAPLPNFHHQNFEGDLLTFLNIRWARPQRAKVFPGLNLAMPGAGKDWTKNYRVPDLLLITADRLWMDCDSHFEGAPNVVVEIHSPGDEAYEKLPFYRDLGVPEVWIIHRDSKQAEIYVPHGGEYDSIDSDAENWLRSPATAIEMKPTGTGKLAIRLAGDDATREELPVE